MKNPKDCGCKLCMTEVTAPPVPLPEWSVEDWHRYVEQCLKYREAGMDDWGFDLPAVRICADCSQLAPRIGKCRNCGSLRRGPQ